MSHFPAATPRLLDPQHWALRVVSLHITGQVDGKTDQLRIEVPRSDCKKQWRCSSGREHAWLAAYYGRTTITSQAPVYTMQAV